MSVIELRIDSPHVVRLYHGCDLDGSEWLNLELRRLRVPGNRALR